MAHYSDPNAPLSVTKAGAVQPVAWCLAVAGAVAVGFVIAFYALTASTKAATDNLQASIAQQDAKLASLQDTATTLADYDATATSLHGLFSGQRRWEDVVVALESVMYKRMRVTALQLSDSGAYSLSATTPSYEDYAKVYAALTSADAGKYFATLKVASVEKDDQPGATDVSFTFTGTLGPSALSASSNN